MFSLFLGEVSQEPPGCGDCRLSVQFVSSHPQGNEFSSIYWRSMALWVKLSQWRNVLTDVYHCSQNCRTTKTPALTGRSWSWPCTTRPRATSSTFLHPLWTRAPSARTATMRTGKRRPLDTSPMTLRRNVRSPTCSERSREPLLARGNEQSEALSVVGRVEIVLSLVECFKIFSLFSLLL